MFILRVVTTVGGRRWYRTWLSGVGGLRIWVLVLWDRRMWRRMGRVLLCRFMLLRRLVRVGRVRMRVPLVLSCRVLVRLISILGRSCWVRSRLVIRRLGLKLLVWVLGFRLVDVLVGRQ